MQQVYTISAYARYTDREGRTKNWFIAIHLEIHNRMVDDS